MNAKPDRNDRSLHRREVLGAGMGGLFSSGCHFGGARGAGAESSMPRLRVSEGRFLRNGAPFFMAGMNYWAALPMARSAGRARWQSVMHELDALAGLGVNVLRIMGATEGPDSEPWRIVPSLQPEQGHYDEASVAGLLRLVEELERRKMYAIVGLTNFWPWSGGMAQYLSWAEGSRLPYPPPPESGDWNAFHAYVARFYSDGRALSGVRDFS